MLRLLALLLCLPASAALACRCSPATFADHVAHADQIFTGRAVRVSGPGGCHALFAVRQRFKGTVPDTLTIRSEPTSCGILFGEGQEYVIFAYQGRVGRCDGSVATTLNRDAGKLLYTFRRSFADSLGRDAAPLLNPSEAFYFNSELQGQRGDFSFQGQRVAFFEGNSPARSDKQQYLRRWAGRFMVHQLLVLTPAERRQSGGYDAIIVFWNKIAVGPAHRRRLVRRLGRHPAP